MPPAILKHVAVTYHPHLEEAAALAPEVSSFLIQSGVETTSGLLADKAVAEGLAERSFDLLVALGGDGMMLRCVHACAPGSVPIVGINLGRFGFLAEFRREEWREGLTHILGGDYWVERRMMLHAEHYHANEKLGEWEVLNDCVVGRGRVMRLLQFAAEVDGQTLATYTADGLIAATATGSTAYALAAGGPILPPELRNILLMPVAPHLSMDRGIVLPEGSTASITVHTDHEGLLSCDGQASERMDDGDRLLVSSGRYEAKFLRVQGRGYFFRNMMSRMKRNS